MSRTVTLRNMADSFVRSSQPSKNYSRLSKMWLDNGDLGLIFFSNPMPRGATVLSAKLYVRNFSTWSGTKTLKAQRITGRWSSTRVTWNNMPSRTGVYSQTKTNAAHKTLWTIDITSLMQWVSDGGAWYGLALDVDDSAPHAVFSANHPATSLRPYVVITWTTQPDPPSKLVPGGGGAVSVEKPTLRFDFDGYGDSELAAFQVQIDGANSFTTPDWDSGEVTASVPQLDLSTSTYPGLAVGASAYWRVRVKDDSGQWSLWSSSTSFSREALGTADWVNPVGYVEEATPPVAWTFSGVQTAYQLRVLSDAGKVLWDSGRVTDDEQVRTIPKNVLKTLGVFYTFSLRIWDDQDRQAVPGDPGYVLLQQDVEFRKVSGVTGTTNLSVTRLPGLPLYQLEWESATMPDSFAIIRNGEVVASDLDPLEHLVSGTTYRWSDPLTPGRASHTWEVARVVNGQQSLTNDTETLWVVNVGPWLMEEDGSNAIMLLDPRVKTDLEEDAAVLYPLEASPVLIIQAQWGFAGEVEGILTDENLPGTRTAKELLERFLVLRSLRGVPLYFLWADQAIRCYVYAASYTASPNPDGTTDYLVSFKFVEA